MPITAIIFDLGGVLCDIDFSLTDRLLQQFGLDGDFFAKNTRLLNQFECGEISSADFCQQLKQQLSSPVTDEQLLDAINSMLLGIPAHRLTLLQSLRKQYDLFLLSNTNCLHINYINNMLQRDYQLNGLVDLFDKTYYSYDIHSRKPDALSFRLVINEKNLDPLKTVFVDDVVENLEAAKRLQLQTLHVPPGSEVCDLLPAWLG